MTARTDHPRPARPFSARGVKLSHLRLMAALAEFGQISRAAQALGLAQPAASRLLAEAQHIAGAALYVRTRRGIALTAEGQALARRAGRALQEIDDAGREMQAMARSPAGEVRVGAVTGAAMQHLLPLVRSARIALPGVTVSVEVATSDVLCRQLLDGKLDFALARRAEGVDARQMTSDPISTEEVSLIVRDGHPLLRQMPVAAAALMDYHWVLPFQGAILRRALDQALLARQMTPPDQVFSTSSFLFTLALVQETNAIAPVASSVAVAFGGEAGAIRALDTDLRVEIEAYALLQQTHRPLTRAAGAVLAMLRERMNLAT